MSIYNIDKHAFEEFQTKPSGEKILPKGVINYSQFLGNLKLKVTLPHYSSQKESSIKNAQSSEANHE